MRNLVDSAISCLTCNRVGFPGECKNVIHCQDQEQCPVTAGTGRRSNSLILVERSVENITCHECCNSSLCNSGGCSSSGFPPHDQRGPVCYNCNTMRDDMSCNRVTLCGRDQLCAIKSSHQSLSHQQGYTTSCESKRLCDVVSHGIGKRGINSIYNKRRNLCFRCCAGDLCNLDCSRQIKIIKM